MMMNEPIKTGRDLQNAVSALSLDVREHPVRLVIEGERKGGNIIRAEIQDTDEGEELVLVAELTTLSAPPTASPQYVNSQAGRGIASWAYQINYTLRVLMFWAAVVGIIYLFVR